MNPVIDHELFSPEDSFVENVPRSSTLPLWDSIDILSLSKSVRRQNFQCSSFANSFIKNIDDIFFYKTIFQLNFSTFHFLLNEVILNIDMLCLNVILWVVCEW